MAAYAALVSLVRIIEQIQHHPRPPFYLDNERAQCLIEKVTSLQDFLELYSHVRNEQVDRLESSIAEAAYAAEDLIETHVVDQILAQSAQHGRRICSVDFYQDLHKVIQDMDFINKKVTEIKERMGSIKDFKQHKSLMPAADSTTSPAPGQNIMVGRDDVLEHIMDKLTRKQHSNLQVIPIVGMGGIGKTAVAKNVYENQYIVQHFDILAWSTLSQEYKVKEILLELLLCLNNQESRESLNAQSQVELRDRLYQSLYSKTYLIILDDMWNIEAWDKIKSSFPKNNEGSRVIITTRQSGMALDLTSGRSDSIIEMKFLKDDISWNLLCKIVFGSDDGCPPNLKKIGRKIVENCQGLPLAIVVIGGLLAKSKKTEEYWEYIAENLHSLEENEHWLNVLYVSYNHLPIHLKPCFLYMGIFREDAIIEVDGLILYWLGEGFLKPVSDKRLEEVAVGYLKELVDRNLILVEKRNHNGEIKNWKIHDMLRDLCLRESQKKKDKFFLVTSQNSLNNSLQWIHTQRRVSIYGITSEEEKPCYFHKICDALQSASLARTLLTDTAELLPISPNFKLLRVLTEFEGSELPQGAELSLKSYILQLVNLRCIMVGKNWKLDTPFVPSLTNLLWNIQILVFDGRIDSFEIWKMPLLRYVSVEWLYLTNPGEDDFVLGNLYTLLDVINFRCSEKMVKRIPNIKNLWITYDDKRYIGSRYCLNNLVHLHKLEILYCAFLNDETPRSELLQNLMFPRCLKELCLWGCRLYWEDISTHIGSLPHLQVLKLMLHSCKGSEWETVEDQFCNLKVLEVSECSDLVYWTTSNSHFPCLDQIILRGMDKLKEIPLCIGEIPTLRLIELDSCSNSAVISAKEIAVEQEEFSNEDLQIQVKVSNEKTYRELESLASENFLVQLKEEEDAA